MICRIVDAIGATFLSWLVSALVMRVIFGEFAEKNNLLGGMIVVSSSVLVGVWVWMRGAKT